VTTTTTTLLTIATTTSSITKIKRITASNALQLHYNYNYNYNITTSTASIPLQLQLQLQLHYTTLHPGVVSEVTTATIAATSKSTTPTTFRSISGFALPSMHATIYLSYSVLSLKLPPPPCVALLVSLAV